MIEKILWFDPQCEPTHLCERCGKEFFGNYDYCTRCREELEDDEEEN